MSRSCLVASLILSVLVVSGGCAKKTVPVVEETPEPVVSDPAMPEPSVVPTTVITEPEPAAPPVVEALPEPADTGLVTVLFEYDSYQLTTSAQRLLQDNAKWLINNPDGTVIIAGHCDERGSDEYNLALGERRALATQDYLAQLGIAPERLAIISYGEERPARIGHEEMAWKQNRRVEFN